MKRTIYSGLVSGMLLITACADGGKGDSETTATTATTATTTGSTDSAGTTTAGTGGTAATDGSGTATTAATNATTTASTGTTAGTTTETTGCSFLACGDMPGGTAECDVWAQDCGDGEKCAAWANDGGSSWNSLKCVPAGADEVGNPCTVEGNGVSGLDSCVQGGMCWNVDPETNEGYCVGLCQGDADACGMPGNSCCGNGETCTIVNMGVLILCLPGCDPLLQTCENGDTCIPNPDGQSFICVIDASGDMGVAGDPCEFANVCDPGLYCIDSGAVEGGCGGATGCCSPWCNLTDPAPCPHPMEECVNWYEPGTEPPGLEDVGICALPQ